MISPTAIFSTALANRARMPIYRVTINGVTTEYATHHIKANYEDVILADAPRGYWRFNEPSGTTATDSSGNALDLTYHGSPTFGVTGPLTKSTSGKAVTFASASTQYADHADTASLDFGASTAFTLEIWFKTATKQDKALISKGQALSGTEAGYELYLRSSGSGQIQYAQAGAAGAGQLGFSYAVAYNDSLWHYVVLKRTTGGALTLYYDGASVATNAGATTDLSNARAFGVGARATGPSDLIDASLSEVAVYPSALTAAKVQAHYDAGLMLYNRTGVSRYLQIPKGIASQLRQDTGIPSVGGFSVVLQDRNGAVTTLISQGIGGKLITLSTGFDDIREDDYQTILTGLISDYQLTPDLAGYELKVQDPQTFLNDSVCETASTALDGAISDSDATITVDDTTYFLSSGTCYLRIEDEWISFTGKTGTTFTGCTRGVLGSTNVAHADGIPVGEMLRLTGHPIDIAIALCTNTDKTGLSMDASLVDSTALAALKTSIGASYSMEFRILSRFNALEFIAQELLAPISCRPVITNAGKFSAVEFAEPNSGDSVGTITDDVICKDRSGRPMIGWAGNFPYLANVQNYNYDIDEIKDQFASHFEDQDDLSVALYGKYPNSIDSRGLRANLSGTSTLIQDRTTALLERYAFGAPLVNARTFLSKLTIEAGDIISLTSAFLTNRAIGTRGITSGLFEVLERRLAFDQGCIDFQLLYTGFLNLRTDDFDRTDTNSSTDVNLGGGDWAFSSESINTPNINTDTLETGVNGFLSGLNYIYSTVADGPNQISELEFAAETGGVGGPAVRVSGDGGYLNATCYLAEYDPTNSLLRLKKFVAQSLKSGTDPGGTTLDTQSCAMIAGDKLRIHVHGTTLNVYLNGALLSGPITDTSISGGRVGIMHTEPDGGEIFWDNWTGGADGWA